MKYRTRLFEVNRELSAARSVFSMLQGEMAIDACEHDIDWLEDYQWRLMRALGKQIRRPLP